MRPARSILLGLAALVLLASPTRAQDNSGPALVLEGSGLLLEALNHRLTIPRPNWVDATATDLEPLVSTSFVIDDVDAVLEIFPRFESRGFWTTIYGAYITRVTGRPLSEFRDQAVAGYAQTCQPALTAFVQLGPDEGENLAPFIAVCGAYALGGDSARGEVMIMTFRQTEQGVGVVYQQWRGKAFDPANPASWPVETAIVEARAAQFRGEVALALVD